MITGGRVLTKWGVAKVRANPELDEFFYLLSTLSRHQIFTLTYFFNIIIDFKNEFKKKLYILFRKEVHKNLKCQK